MSKCGLCGREMSGGELSYNTFGLLSPESKFCPDCFEDVKRLRSKAPKMDDGEYQSVRSRFKGKYNNAAADTILTQIDATRTSASESELISVGGIYDNPGRTMITLAKAIFFIISAISLVLAIVLANFSYDFNFLLFLVTVLVGVLVAYLTGLFLAAFGHLVSDVKFIRSLLSTRK